MGQNDHIPIKNRNVEKPQPPAEGNKVSPHGKMETICVPSESAPSEGPSQTSRTTAHTSGANHLHILLESSAGVEDDGYFKLVPGNGGKSWYCVYRWRWGQWANHYVMAIVSRGDLRYGLALLTEKINEVRSGSRKPTLDKYRD